MSEFLNNVRDIMRKKHYSIRTENAYTDWIKRYIICHGKRHPKEMGESEISQFLTHLAMLRQAHRTRRLTPLFSLQKCPSG
ncbi:MAG: hypothetical protein GY749_19185 [Desulfobacteraceae bacterium]|nr:hypothetical protein [Desulfobacteraceae bacterium]